MSNTTRDRDYEYIDVVEQAKLIRAALKRAFPGFKFSVRSSKYSMGASIDIKWEDGPTTKEVEQVTDQYRGGGFDGMIDYAYSLRSWLLPDGSAVPAERYRPHELSEKIDPPCEGARLVSFGGDYVHCHRTLTADHWRRAYDKFINYWHVEPGDEPTVKNGYPEAGGTTRAAYQHLDQLRREGYELSDYTRPEAEPEAEPVKATGENGNTGGGAEPGAVTLTDNGSSVWLSFPEKPGRDVLNAINGQGLGFRWSPKRLAWYHKSGEIDPEQVKNMLSGFGLVVTQGDGKRPAAAKKSKAAGKGKGKAKKANTGGGALTAEQQAAAAAQLAEERIAQLKKAADKLREKAEGRRGLFSNQNVTARRARFIASGVQEAERYELAADMADLLVEWWQAGTVPGYLKGVKTQKCLDNMAEAVQRHRNGGIEPRMIRRYAKQAGTGSPGVKMGEAIELFTNELGAAAARRRAAAQIADRRREVMLGGYGVDFFPTPAGIVEQVIDLADIEPGMLVLEPSAGRGDLALAAQAAGGTVHAVELSPTLAELCRDQGITCETADFIKWAGLHVQFFDRVIMNPPFSNGCAVEHVRAAYDLLVDGGRLVAIMPESIAFRNDGVYKGFREWLDEHLIEEIELPAGAFQSSGTGVKTRIVVLVK